MRQRSRLDPGGRVGTLSREEEEEHFLSDKVSPLVDEDDDRLFAGAL